MAGNVGVIMQEPSTPVEEFITGAVFRKSGSALELQTTF